MCRKAWEFESPLPHAQREGRSLTAESLQLDHIPGTDDQPTG